MKKTLIALSVAGFALAAGLTIGTAQAATPVKIITSNMGGNAVTAAVVTVEVAADKTVSAKVVESTGNAAADKRIEKLMVGSVDPAVALKNVGEGKGVRYSNVPVTIQYVGSGCVAPMSSTVADIIDPAVICAPQVVGLRSGQ